MSGAKLAPPWLNEPIASPAALAPASAVTAFRFSSSSLPPSVLSTSDCSRASRAPGAMSISDVFLAGFMPTSDQNSFRLASRIALFSCSAANHSLVRSFIMAAVLIHLDLAGLHLHPLFLVDQQLHSLDCDRAVALHQDARLAADDLIFVADDRHLGLPYLLPAADRDALVLHPADRQLIAAAHRRRLGRPDNFARRHPSPSPPCSCRRQ